MAVTLELHNWIPKLEAKLQKIDLEALSIECGFRRRSSRKAATYPFLLGFFIAASANAFSLMAIAFSIGKQIGGPLSKKAVHKRFHEGFITLLENLLARLLSERLFSIPKDSYQSHLQPFTRILIQDSTTIALPSQFAEAFPGPANSSKKSHATAKLQLIYDALHERFLRIDLNCFRDNDQKAAPDILLVAQANDLVMRDLGYFTLPSLHQMIQQSVFFISRLKFGIHLFSDDGITDFNLVKYLRRHKQVDRRIQLGKEAKVPVRLVAIPVSKAVATDRRRKAKNNRDRRTNPSKEHLYLLGYDIFITNVGEDVWTVAEVQNTYRIRWRIEIIFKAWKSHFRLTELHTRSALTIKAAIYARLILITVFHQHCFAPLYYQLYSTEQVKISLLKTAVLIRIAAVYAQVDTGKSIGETELYEQIAYHAAYEKRKHQRQYPDMVYV